MARRALLDLGFECLGRRVRTSHGEIDLVVRRKSELVCVEVKTALAIGPGAQFRPGNRFRPTQLRRQRTAARAVARELRHTGRVEVALCEVWLDEHDRLVRMEWHRGLLEAGDLPRS